MSQLRTDQHHMERACELALHGQGAVEPNPMVGCVIARGDTVLGEGYHRKYGGRHAEIRALDSVAKSARLNLKDASLYVTLEPCCHHGKTPPCTEAIISAGIGRVVVAVVDPSPLVAGRGIEALREAGIVVEVGIAVPQASALIAPYSKLNERGLPWVIAKWAMTLDGKIASSSRDSQWISSPESRQIVHRLRGRVDAVIVGIETALQDDPMLTARPAGSRVATRVVLDSMGRLPLRSKLADSVGDAPVLVLAGPEADPARLAKLQDIGIEVIQSNAQHKIERVNHLLQELGRRRLTNVLVEGGAKVLGSFLDSHLIDEVHAFVAPKLLGGKAALTAIAGNGVSEMSSAVNLADLDWRQVGPDMYIQGRIDRTQCTTA